MTIASYKISSILKYRSFVAFLGAWCLALLASPILAQSVKTPSQRVMDGRYVEGPASNTVVPSNRNERQVEPPTIGYGAPLRETVESLSPAQISTPEQNIAGQVIKKAKASRGKLTKSETDAMISYYEKADPELLWVTSEGLSLAAEKAIVELKNADSYGLDPSSYKIPQIKSSPPSEDELAVAEFTLTQSVLRYARHAKAGRVRVGQVGSQLTQTPKPMEPALVLAMLKETIEPDDVLSSLHPKHPQFKKLREKLLELSGGQSDKQRVKLPDGPALRKGMDHPQVAILRKRLGLPANGEQAEMFDELVEKAVKDFQKKNGSLADGIVGPGTRRALNGHSDSKVIRKIKINMERWRWLPDDMDGDAGLYVWANIPDLRVRVIKDGQIVFSEKSIVGLVTHKTPVFSDMMEWIEIHPTWFVPNSIKVNDILPSLRRPTSTVIKRYNLKVNCGAYGSNPKKIDWNKIDISKCSFTQPAGPKSVLGDFKFKFPNKHSVYLHDTHKPELFKGKQRTYSHGCIRVQNPRSLAAILLENDKGMSAQELDRIVDGPKTLRTEKLTTHVPIHITYFTALFDDDGNFVTRPDYYGHDSRLIRALRSGGDALPQTAKKQSKRKKTVKKKVKKQAEGWWGNLF